MSGRIAGKRVLITGAAVEWVAAMRCGWRRRAPI